MFEILQIYTVHGNLQHYNSQITLSFHLGRIEGEVGKKEKRGGRGKERGRKDGEERDNYDKHVCEKKKRKWEERSLLFHMIT